MSERAHGRSPYRLAYEGSQAALMQALSRPLAATESSATISRNAKGVAQFEVVVRGIDPFECASTAQTIYEQLAQDFPYPLGAPESPSEPPTPIRKPRGRRTA